MLPRRRSVIGALSTGAWACSPSLVVRSRPPQIPHGVQRGDVQPDRAPIWARCDEPARIVVEWDTTERFDQPRRVAGPVVGPDSDGAATVAIEGLPGAQTVCCRVRFEREAARGTSAWAGRERELAGILAALADRGVKDLVWRTADVHDAAAHHDDPARAAGPSNLPPWDGLQSSGTVDATADALTVALRGIDGAERHRVELPHG